VVNTTWHTYWAIEKFAPAAATGMHAARRQHGEVGFVAINRIHQPVALAAMLLLLATDLPGWRREPLADLDILAGTATAALLANAFVCGVLSNPHDRYRARLVAPLVVTLLLCRLDARRGLSQERGKADRRSAGGGARSSGLAPSSTHFLSYFRRKDNATKLHWPLDIHASHSACGFGRPPHSPSARRRLR
jgi:hypothetical protein